jgi:hypothetical protein
MGPTVQGLAGARMPQQSTQPWLSIIPINESRSSYNGLLLFLFILVSTLITIEAIHRFASHRVRRGPPWDCGFPDANPATQYTADSFAQPIRRVFGTVLLGATERVDMPAPGDARPARLAVSVRDLAWEALYAPVSALVSNTSERLNRLQFLTIRQYLSLVFAALVSLLLVVSIWQ